MDDYHDLYLKADILLWADVFEKVIDMCLEYYVLDPRYYFCDSWLSWDSMLQMTGIELEVIWNKHVFIWWKRNKRRYFLDCSMGGYL